MMRGRLALLLLAAAITTAPEVAARRAPVEDPPRSAPLAKYVALGSSFAAGPGIGQPAPGSHPLCGQSTENYARLLARTLHLSLVDRSCNGSKTKHILQGGQHDQPAQIDAVTAETKLVTITTGGNDVNYVGGLWAWSCALRPQPMPEQLRKLACSTHPAENDAPFATLGLRLREIAAEVHRRAPHARLVFVDYVTVLPAKTGCPERLPLSAQQLKRGRRVAARLAKVTADAAQASGAMLIRASRMSRRHDVCSRDPWTIGWTFPASILDWGPLAYHPKPAAMSAIAKAIERKLGGTLGDQNRFRTALAPGAGIR